MRRQWDGDGVRTLRVRFFGLVLSVLKQHRTLNFSTADGLLSEILWRWFEYVYQGLDGSVTINKIEGVNRHLLLAVMMIECGEQVPFTVLFPTSMKLAVFGQRKLTSSPAKTPFSSCVSIDVATSKLAIIVFEHPYVVDIE